MPGFVEEQRVERLAVLGAELEDVADFDGALDLERLAAFGAGLARLHEAQVRPVRDLDVAPDGDVAQVEAVLVGAGGHLGGVAQALVGIDRQSDR